MSNRTPLWGYLTALAISVSGTRLSMIAIPWFVLTSTGSATKTGLVAFAEMAPLVLLQVPGRAVHRPHRRPADGADLRPPSARSWSAPSRCCTCSGC